MRNPINNKKSDGTKLALAEFNNVMKDFGNKLDRKYRVSGAENGLVDRYRSKLKRFEGRYEELSKLRKECRKMGQDLEMSVINKLSSDFNQLSFAFNMESDHTFKGRPPLYSWSEDCYKCIRIKRQLGHGAFGIVYSGELITYIPSQKQMLPLEEVAVKEGILREGNYEDIARRFRRQAELWSTLKYKNVVPFKGLFYNIQGVDMPYIVGAFANQGTAKDFLKKRENKIHAETIINGILQGIEDLHSGKACYEADTKKSYQMCHGDINPSNLLVNWMRGSAPVAWVSDFDLTAEIRENGTTPTNQSGSDTHTAPEILKAGEATAQTRKELMPKADVYALGLTIYELMTGTVAIDSEKVDVYPILYSRNKNSPKWRAELEKLLPEMHPRISPELFEVLKRCWSFEPQDRPTVQELRRNYLSLTKQQKAIRGT